MQIRFKKYSKYLERICRKINFAPRKYHLSVQHNAKMMKRTVKIDVLRRLAHHNLYARGGRTYDERNAIACSEAMAAYGWELPVWVTLNQITNASGKYMFKHLALLPGEQPRVTIAKRDHATSEMVYTQVYNIDQTNMASAAPGAYDLLCQGKTFDEVVDALMHQPLFERAMQTGRQTPRSFWHRIAAAF